MSRERAIRVADQDKESPSLPMMERTAFSLPATTMGSAGAIASGLLPSRTRKLMVVENLDGCSLATSRRNKWNSGPSRASGNCRRQHQGLLPASKAGFLTPHLPVGNLGSFVPKNGLYAALFINANMLHLFGSIKDQRTTE